jgi:hypothetical protein
VDEMVLHDADMRSLYLILRVYRCGVPDYRARYKSNVALFFIITEFLFYKETIDPFVKKKTSYNAYGYRKASGETKRRIIFFIKISLFR